MNVLLIHPDAPDKRRSLRRALAYIRRKMSLPPMGMLTVAGMVPGKWTMRLVDSRVAALTDEDLKWADFACLNARSVENDSARGILARCREAGVNVVAGSPLAYHRI